MTKSSRKNVPDVGIELGTAGMPSGAVPNKCFDQVVSSEVTMTSTVFKKAWLTSEHMNLHKHKPTSLIANVLAKKL